MPTHMCSRTKMAVTQVVAVGRAVAAVAMVGRAVMVVTGSMGVATMVAAASRGRVAETAETVAMEATLV